MHAAKEKVSDMASSAKEKVTKFKARAEEKAEKPLARTKEEKEMVHEREKAREAEAEMEKHQEKAENRAEWDAAKHGTATRIPLFHGPGGPHHRPIGTTGMAPGADTHDPTYTGTGGRAAGEKYL